MQALVLIDIQNDYFKGGANPLVGSEEASLQARSILHFFRNADLPVIHIQHISRSNSASFFRDGTSGIQIHENVAVHKGEKLIVKHFPNAFKETNLHEYLSSLNITELVICGMMTHMCVDSSVRAASDYGYKVLLIGDACATKDLKWKDKVIPSFQVQAAFLSALDGTFAGVSHAERFLKEQKV